MTGHFENTFLSINVGLQITDALLDARVTALEESGDANEQNGNPKQRVFLTSRLNICRHLSDISLFNWYNQRNEKNIKYCFKFENVHSLSII